LWFTSHYAMGLTFNFPSNITNPVRSPNLSRSNTCFFNPREANASRDTQKRGYICTTIPSLLPIPTQTKENPSDSSHKTLSCSVFLVQNFRYTLRTVHRNRCLTQTSLDRMRTSEDLRYFFESAASGFDIEEVNEEEFEDVPEDEEEVVLRYYISICCS